MKNKVLLVMIVGLAGLVGIFCYPISKVLLGAGVVTLLVGIYGIKADLLSTLSFHSDLGLGEYLGKVSFAGMVIGVLEIFAGCLWPKVHQVRRVIMRFVIIMVVSLFYLSLMHLSLVA